MKRFVSLIIAVAILACSVCITVPAEESMPGIILEKYSLQGDELAVDLYFTDYWGSEICGFIVDVKFSDNLALKRKEYMYGEGTAVFTEIASGSPCRVAVMLGTSSFPREKTLIARFIFTIVSGNGGSWDITARSDEVLDMDLRNLAEDGMVSFTDFHLDTSETVRFLRIREIPDKTEYYVGDSEFDLTGGSVSIEYWSGIVEPMRMSEEMISGYGTNKEGEGKVFLEVGGVHTSFSITVVQPPVLPGDANGDGKVSLLDATLMLQLIAYWDVGTDVNGDAVDVNGDGKMSLLDVTSVLQYIAGWDVLLK